MATSMADLGFNIDSSPMRRATTEMDKMSRGAGKAEKSVAGFGGAANIARAAVAAFGAAVGGMTFGRIINESATFEQGMRNVAAVSGATADELERLTASALGAAASTRFNPQQTTQALYALAASGQNAADQMASLSNVLNLAEAGQADLGRATELTTSTLNQFGLGADQSARVADVFVASIGASALNVDRLQVAMRNAGPTAAALGQSLEGTTATIGMLTTAFGNGERAGTGFRAILNELPAKANELGISVRDANGQFLPMIDILESLEAQGIDSAKAVETFGAEAGPSLAALLRNGSGALRDMEQRLQSTGQAADVAASQLDTLRGDMDALSSSVSVAMIAMGDSQSGMMRDATQTVTNLIRLWSGYGDTIGEQREQTQQLSVAIQTAAAAAGGMAALSAAIGAASAAQAAFNVAARANPYILIGSTIVSATAAVYAFVNAQESALDVWERAQESEAAYQSAMANVGAQNRIQEITKERMELQEQLQALEDKGFKKYGRDANRHYALKKDLADLEREYHAITDARIDAEKARNERQAEADQREKDAKEEQLRLQKEMLAAINGTGAAIKSSIISPMQAVSAEIERARDLLEYGIGADEDPFEPVVRGAELAIETVADLLEQAKFLKEYGFSAGDDPFADFSGSAEDAAKETEKEFDRAAERVADTLQRTIASGDWQGIGDMVGATLASSIGGKVSKAIGGDVLGPLMGGIAGGVVQLAISEAIRYASEIDDPTQRRQATQGTGTVLGSIDEKSQSISDAVEGIESTNDQLVNINTGMLSALRSLQTGIAGASGGAARAASGVDANLSVQRSAFDYIPGVGQLDDLFGGALSGLLGGRSKLVDEGIQLMGGALSDLAGQTMSGALVSAYNTVAKKKHFLDDYDNYTQVTALSDSVQQQFAQVFGGIAESVMAGAEAIGIAPQSVQDALDRFVVESQKISLEGLNAEERAAELEAVFSSIFDSAVTASVPFIRRFQEAGEGLGETLARVATEVQLTQEAIDTVGIRITSTSAEWVSRHSNRLVGMVGGVEAFSNSLVSLESNFLSATENVENNQRRLKDALGGLGLPETREQYLELIRAQNASSKSGAQNVATLLKLQGAADEYYTAMERQQEEALQKQQEIANERLSLEERWLSLTGQTAEIRRRELEALDPSNRYLQERIWALQDERESVEGVVAARREALNSEIAIQRAHAQSAQEAANAVQSALGRMVMDTREVRMRSQQSALSALQASVRSGSVTAGDSLDRNLSAATAIQMSDYATFGEYVRDYTRTTSTLVQLKEITDRQVTTEERMLSNLEKQLNSMDGLRKELEQSQLAIIKQTNKTAKILERFEVDGIEVRA